MSIGDDMSKDKKDYKLQLETPTLARRVIVVENAYFKDQLRHSANELKKILDRYAVKRKAASPASAKG